MIKPPSRKSNKKPLAILVYGVEGVGKTTFSLSAPSCVLLGNENGEEHLDVPTPLSFDIPKTWTEFMEQVRWLGTNKHDAKTIVIDSLDSLERLIEADLLRPYPGQTMEKAEAFQALWKATIKYWRELMDELDKLRAKGFMVILIGHAEAGKFTDAKNQAEYSKYQLALYKNSAAAIKRWVDAILFATFDVTVESKKNQKDKAKGGRTRSMYTSHEAGFDGKNRLGLPEVMDFTWAAFSEAAGLNLRPAKEIYDDIHVRLAQILDEVLRDRIFNEVVKVKDNSTKLDAYLKRIEEIITKQDEVA